MSMQKIILESIPWPMTASEPAHRPTIMIVDDSATVRKIVEISLQRADYAVLSCADGVEALHALLAPGVPLPDLILLDIEMPRMNGYQLARLCQRKPQLAHIPLVMLSRRVGVVDRLKARLCHVRASLSKPFTTRQLLTTIALALGQSTSLSEVQEEQSGQETEASLNREWTMYPCIDPSRRETAYSVEEEERAKEREEHVYRI